MNPISAPLETRRQRSFHASRRRERSTKIDCARICRWVERTDCTCAVTDGASWRDRAAALGRADDSALRPAEELRLRYLLSAQPGQAACRAASANRRCAWSSFA
ncbi:hypothetical protein [Dactylosporangium salmoneum]|uniref:hypothetical protein n=1 Tax=Dactylosporangium salmoneum TaxID=53361 RepID=UPI0031DF8474